LTISYEYSSGPVFWGELSIKMITAALAARMIRTARAPRIRLFMRDVYSLSPSYNSTHVKCNALYYYLTSTSDWQLENATKKFHFVEMDWIVYFPKCGNKGKYLTYNVVFIDRKKGTNQPEQRVRLDEIVENREFENCYPHTVGFYKASSGEGEGFKPEYLEIRRIDNVEEFWLFLNALDI
jgi:hypothetical protein